MNQIDKTHPIVLGNFQGKIGASRVQSSAISDLRDRTSNIFKFNDGSTRNWNIVRLIIIRAYFPSFQIFFLIKYEQFFIYFQIL